MYFIDLIEVGGYETPARKSSLAVKARLFPDALHVVGVMPHNYMWKPASAKDRDNLVAFLNTMEYPS